MEHHQQQQAAAQGAPAGDVHISGPVNINSHFQNFQYFPSNFNPYLHHNIQQFTAPQQRAMQQGQFLNNNNNTINLLYGSESRMTSASVRRETIQTAPPWGAAPQQQLPSHVNFCPPPPFVTMGDFAYTEEFFK